MFKPAIVLCLAAALINDLVAEDAGPPFGSTKTGKSSSKSTKNDVHMSMAEESTAPKAFKGGKSSKVEMSLGGDMSMAKAFKDGKSAKIEGNENGKCSNCIAMLFRALLSEHCLITRAIGIGSCV